MSKKIVLDVIATDSSSLLWTIYYLSIRERDH
jgi:hypothetical protein